MKRVFLSVALFAAFAAGWAANSIQKVTQVSTPVTVSGNIDYVISSTTPFVTGGAVDITDTEHSVVIIQNVKPSKVISAWLKNYVKINGETAVNGTNCQVRMYAQGAIILPYDRDIKPLTVYSEQNFTGESCSDFGLENTGGYMNTLTDEKLNNRIRSFRLKRGYMVTFSTRASGRGYSRCFIADQEDLEFAVMPDILDESITSYRVFQWFNAPKKGLASDTNSGDNALVNSSWCYDWGTGINLLPDVECVPNHIYEDWPSSSACGSVTYSCHMKTNNEPANSADDHPQSVAEVLANWENLMRTGMRLCSPATHDGGWNWHNEFMKAIDERGWRCDIVDFHGYWDGEWNSLDWRIDTYAFGRPVWFSEWVWGASWNNNGAFNVSNRDDFDGNSTRTYNGTKPIIDRLNSTRRVERYAYWNSERNCSKIFSGSKLSKTGEYYAATNPGLGYDKANEFIPKNPAQYDPSNLTCQYDAVKQEVTLRFHERNGEYNKSIIIQQRVPGSYSWADVQKVRAQESEADYEVTIPGVDGIRYRICVNDANGVSRYTNEALSVIENLKPGDAVSVTIDNTTKTMYMGGNMLLNGDFLLGTYDWTTGTDAPLSLPYYQVVPRGGVGDSPYLQCYGDNSEVKHEQSIRKIVKLRNNTPYYVSGSGCHGNETYQRMSSSRSKTLENNIRARFADVSEWTEQGSSFVVNNDTLLLIFLRQLAGKAQFDEFRICQLFSTVDSAMADALALERQRVAVFAELYASRGEALVQTLEDSAAVMTDANRLESLLQSVWLQMEKSRLESDREQRPFEYETILPFSADTVPYRLFGIQAPDFASSVGWETKVGNFFAGTQQTSTQAGLTCWSAMSNKAAGTDEVLTMAVRQSVTISTHGLYALSCKAGTPHACETDQHAWLSDNVKNDTVCTPAIDLGCLDIPTFGADRWRQLTTPYIYVDDRTSLSFGFIGSKTAADQGRHIDYGKPGATLDNKEGSWCATGFELRYIPMRQVQVDSTGWGTVCLPGKIVIPEGVRLYQCEGILTDGTALALTEVFTPVAGYPYIFHSEKKDTTLYFFEVDTFASSEKKSNGLRGKFYNISSQYRLNSFKLEDGAFRLQSVRTVIPSYTAYIQAQDELSVVDSWQGETIPVYGAVSAIEQVGIEDGPAMQSIYFNLQGQRVRSSHGIVIEKGRKILK